MRRLEYVLLSGLAAGSVAAQEPPFEPFWTLQIGSDGWDIAFGGAVDADGNSYVVGDTGGDLAVPAQGLRDGFAAKVSPSGALIWLDQIGTDGLEQALSVALDGQGDPLVVGRTSGDLAAPRVGHEDIFLIKYSRSGEREWVRQFGTDRTDIPFGVATGPGDVIAVTGYTAGDLGGPLAGEIDIFLAMRDQAGHELWSRQIGTALDDEGRCVAIDAARGIVAVAGGVEAETSVPWAGDAIIATFDLDGNELWSTRLGSAPLGDILNAVTFDGPGNLYVAGETYGDLAATNPNPDFQDIFVAKLDASGDILWMRQYGTPGPDAGDAVAISATGSIFVSGSVSEGMLFPPELGGADGFLMEISPDGDLLWGMRLGTASLDETMHVATGRPRHVTCVGFTGADLGGPHAGGFTDAYVMDLGHCYEDCDNSGFTDIFDFLCFQDAFVQGAAYADCDTNGQFDIFDFLCFQDAFAGGCR